MKWLVASDIHGSAFYCKKLMESFEKEKADRMLLLGDILYHGPRNDLPKDYNPKQVIAMLNERRNDIYCIRGNCDTEVDQMVLEFPILADYCVIANNKQMIYATHGHIYNEKNYPPMHKGDILLQGHTHVPAYLEKDGFIFMNPGSASIAKENSHHGYMLIEGNKYQWKDFNGTVVKEVVV